MIQIRDIEFCFTTSSIDIAITRPALNLSLGLATLISPATSPSLRYTPRSASYAYGYIGFAECRYDLPFTAGYMVQHYHGAMHS